MAIYLVIFLITISLFYLAERLPRGQRRATAFAAILIPSVIAGIRADRVGTDVLVYGKSFYLIAVNASDLPDLFHTLASVGIHTDYGFHVLNFVLSRVSDNYHLGLFAYMFITILLFYTAFRRIKKIYHIRIWFGMVFFLFYYYNLSLNMMDRVRIMV